MVHKRYYNKSDDNNALNGRQLRKETVKNNGCQRRLGREGPSQRSTIHEGVSSFPRIL